MGGGLPLAKDVLVRFLVLSIRADRVVGLASCTWSGAIAL